MSRPPATGFDEMPEWADGLRIAITVTDENGRIAGMNERAGETFAAEGGLALLGTSVFDCHPEPSRSKLAALYASAEPNHYTISRGGQRKVIHQLPWFREGKLAGFVEISVPIPDRLPHFDRD